MKNILVPIHFDECSFNALQYAIDMNPNSEITVLHVSTGIYGDKHFSFSQDKLLPEGLDKAIQKVINETIITPSSVSIKITVIKGAVIDSILNFSIKNPFDLCLIGTREKQNIFDKWLGTTAISLVKKLKIPTYCIPRYGSFKSFKKAVVGSNNNLLNKKYLSRLKKWNREFNSYLKFHHVIESANDNFSLGKENIISELFENENTSFSFDISLAKADNITNELLHTAYNLPADW